MRISARTRYALRAAAEPAARRITLADVSAGLAED